ncbi:MAG: adenylate/guanylate cyclase domain-containing protein [Gemmataceae bacterium]
MLPRPSFANPGFRGLVAGVVVAMLVWLAGRAGLFDGLEDWALDEAFVWRGRRATAARVVLVGIDEESIRRLGKNLSYVSPELARVVRYANAQGASAIGIDVLIHERQQFNPEIMRPGGSGTPPRWARRSARRGTSCSLAGTTRSRPAGRGERPLAASSAPVALKALNEETRADTDLAFVHLNEDGDRFVRRQQLLASEGGELRVQFGYALYCVSRGEGVRHQDGVPLAGGDPVPLDERGCMLVNYVGPPGTFPAVPLHEALRRIDSGERSADWAGAVVLVGVTARGRQDYHSTPYSNTRARWLPGPPPGRMSGLEYHANVIATLTDRAFVHTPRWLAPLPVLLVTGLALGWAYSGLRLGGGLLLWLGHFVGWKALAVLAFALAGARLPVVGVLVLSGLLYTVALGLRWKRGRRLLRVFLSGPIADRVEQQPADRRVEERVVTVLFADIRDFTRFSEATPPEQVSRLLQGYFDVVVPIIEGHGGVVNTFMGDGVLALFNAAADDPAHAEHAVRAAAAMVREVRDRAARWKAMGFDPMRIGVGVHTGPTAVGAVGSSGRLHFTVVGDTPNTAARIEAENKALGTEVLISAATRAALGPLAAELGCEPSPHRFTPKGKRKVVEVHAVVV